MVSLSKQCMVSILRAFLFASMAQIYLTYFFVDDSLLFFRAQVEDVIKIQEILGKYEVAFGQKINFERTQSSLVKMSLCLQRNMFKIYWGSRQLESMKSI